MNLQIHVTKQKLLNLFSFLGYHLFLKLTSFLAREKCWSNKRVIEAVNWYFEEPEETYYQEEIVKLKETLRNVHWASSGYF